MWVTVYVNWYDQSIISRADYEKMLSSKETEVCTDDIAFAEWIDEHYAAFDIWNMDETQRAKVLEGWERQAYEYAKEELANDGWAEYEIDI